MRPISEKRYQEYLMQAEQIRLLGDMNIALRQQIATLYGKLELLQERDRHKTYEEHRKTK